MVEFPEQTEEAREKQIAILEAGIEEEKRKRRIFPERPQAEFDIAREKLEALKEKQQEVEKKREEQAISKEQRQAKTQQTIALQRAREKRARQVGARKEQLEAIKRTEDKQIQETPSFTKEQKQELATAFKEGKEIQFVPGGARIVETIKTKTPSIFQQIEEKIPTDSQLGFPVKFGLAFGREAKKGIEEFALEKKGALGKIPSLKGIIEPIKRRVEPIEKELEKRRGLEMPSFVEKPFEIASKGIVTLSIFAAKDIEIKSPTLKELSEIEPIPRESVEKGVATILKFGFFAPAFAGKTQFLEQEIPVKAFIIKKPIGIKKTPLSKTFPREFKLGFDDKKINAVIRELSRRRGINFDKLKRLDKDFLRGQFKAKLRASPEKFISRKVIPEVRQLALKRLDIKTAQLSEAQLRRVILKSLQQTPKPIDFKIIKIPRVPKTRVKGFGRITRVQDIGRVTSTKGFQQVISKTGQVQLLKQIPKVKSVQALKIKPLSIPKTKVIDLRAVPKIVGGLGLIGSKFARVSQIERLRVFEKQAQLSAQATGLGLKQIQIRDIERQTLKQAQSQAFAPKLLQKEAFAQPQRQRLGLALALRLGQATKLAQRSKLLQKQAFAQAQPQLLAVVQAQTQKLRQPQMLLTQQVLKQAEVPKIPIPFFFKRRRREKRERVGRGFEDVAISEGFVARQLGLKPIRISKKEFQRLSSVPSRAISIRRAPIITIPSNKRRRRRI